jgi:cellobiose-specific phosphotransferase system component IIC
MAAVIVVSTLVFTLGLYHLLHATIEPRASTALTDAISLATAIIVALYTLETYRMRKLRKQAITP